MKKYSHHELLRLPQARHNQELRAASTSLKSLPAHSKCTIIQLVYINRSVSSCFSIRLWNDMAHRKKMCVFFYVVSFKAIKCQKVIEWRLINHFNMKGRVWWRRRTLDSQWSNFSYARVSIHIHNLPSIIAP